MDVLKIRYYKEETEHEPEKFGSPAENAVGVTGKRFDPRSRQGGFLNRRTEDRHLPTIRLRLQALPKTAIDAPHFKLDCVENGVFNHWLTFYGRN